MITPHSLKIIRDLNLPGGEPDFGDYLSHVREGPEVAFVYGKIFWPDLIEVDGFVLLSENYDEVNYKRIRSEYPDSVIEDTINTTYIDDLFGAGDIDVSDEVWEALGQLICETWKARAELLFKRPFVCEFNWYSEYGEPGVTMYQQVSSMPHSK
jgi:hypothetical protein